VAASIGAALLVRRGRAHDAHATGNGGPDGGHPSG
jgi:hypothetical protein